MSCSSRGDRFCGFDAGFAGLGEWAQLYATVRLPVRSVQSGKEKFERRAVQAGELHGVVSRPA